MVEFENQLCAQLVKFCFYCGSDNIKIKDIGTEIKHTCRCCGKQNLLPKKLHRYEEAVYKYKNPPTLKGHLKHRVNAEKKLKRRLTAFEVVHHIDTNQKNFKFDNLFVTKSLGHGKAHASLRNVCKELIEKKIIKFDEVKGVYYYEPM